MAKARDVVRKSPHRTVGAVAVLNVSAEPIPWESRLEQHTIILLSLCHDVRSIESQPFQLDFTGDGTNQKYFPDLLVETDAGKILAEVKPLFKVIQEDLVERFRQIRRRATELGYQFALVTDEVALQQPRLGNASLLRRYQSTSVPDKVRRSIKAYLTAHGARPIADVMRAAAASHRDLLALLARRQLCVDWQAPITHDSPVSLPDTPFKGLSHADLLSQSRTDRLLSPMAVADRAALGRRLAAEKARGRGAAVPSPWSFVGGL